MDHLHSELDSDLDSDLDSELNRADVRTPGLDVAAELGQLCTAYDEMQRHYAQELAELQDALASRKVIGQAIGMVMYEFQLTEEAAFETLARRSQRSNVKVRALAEQMVERANTVGRVLWPVPDC